MTTNATERPARLTTNTGIALGIVLVILSSVATGGVLAGSYGSRVQTVEAQLAEARGDIKEWTKEVRAAREDIREIRVLLLRQAKDEDTR